MAEVTVKFFASVREAVGIRSMKVQSRNINELIDTLSKEFGRAFTDTVLDEDGKIKRFFSIMVNGKRIELLDGFDTVLEDDDAVAIFPPVGGG